jgi:fatty-acyl-CoA synthase
MTHPFKFESEGLMRAWAPITLGKQLDLSADDYGELEFMVFGERRLTFQETKAVVDQLAKGLIQLGIQKGDNLAVWMTNYPEFVICWFALAKTGAAMIPINTRYKTNEVKYILEQSESKALIMMDRFLNIDYIEMIYELCPQLKGASRAETKYHSLPDLKHVICLSTKNYPGIHLFQDILEMGRDVEDTILLERESSVNVNDNVVIIYTSGTTGRPKGAVHSHMILKNEYVITRWLGVRKSDRYLAYLPFFHIAGGFSVILPCLLAGACLVLMESFDVEEALRLIQDERCTVISGIPTHFIMMMEHPNFSNYDLSAARAGWVGGSQVTKEVALGIRNKMGMKDMVIVYGMTETTSVTTFTKVGDTIEHITQTDGIPISEEFEIKIVDLTAGEEVPPGEEGELLVRGYIVMKEYYKMPDETAKCIDKDGWFHTGDLAKRFEDGYIKITGRVKDMFIVGGTNTYPAEIEAFLQSNAKIKQVYVAGVPDHRLGEVGMAFVELKDGETAKEEEIIEYCKGKIANYKIPRYVKFMKEFPLTPSGKIKKYVLVEQAVKERHLET